jgi:hypothetical protein
MSYCKHTTYGYLVPRMPLVDFFDHGKEESLQPRGKPLYPIPMIILFPPTMHAPTFKKFCLSLGLHSSRSMIESQRASHLPYFTLDTPIRGCTSSLRLINMAYNFKKSSRFKITQTSYEYVRIPVSINSNVLASMDPCYAWKSERQYP